MTKLETLHSIGSGISDVQHRVFTTGEIARFTGGSARTVAKWVDSNELDGYKLPVSGDRRITIGSWEAFCKRNNMVTPWNRMIAYLRLRKEIK